MLTVVKGHQRDEAMKSYTTFPFAMSIGLSCCFFEMEQPQLNGEKGGDRKKQQQQQQAAGWPFLLHIT
eukprot:m.73434 g.73434  ORF g.73434 m.73434 type:complete len:68 (-) comp13892_c0_seq1:324-527(-)